MMKLQTIAISTAWAVLAGLIASLLSTLMMGILYFTLGVPTPVELFGDYVLKHIDVHTFIRLLLTFAPNGKTTPLGIALLSMIGIGTLLALLYAALVIIPLPTQGYRPHKREWIVAASLTGAMTLVGILLFWDELRQNLYGLPVLRSSLATAVGLAINFATYGIALCLAYRALLPKVQKLGEEGVTRSRRQLFTRAGVTALGVGAGLGTYGLVQHFLKNFTYYDGFKVRPKITPPITPNDQHYVVTQNAIDPTPHTDVWRLEVTGLVNKSGAYTYEEVQKLPSTSRAVTLECIANGVGNFLMSTAIWQGVPLRTLLEQHGGATDNATHIAFHSVDGYTISLPLQEVLASDALLAYRMNGVELPQRHGYPLRVLIPGRFGEENPKWLTRVELTNHFVHGLYSSQGWYNGPVHTTTRIDRPKGRIPFTRSIEIAGIAYAGDRGIQKVEVSINGGQNWQVAKLEAEISPDAWRLWSWQWQPTERGNYTVVARATDGKGEVQTSRSQITVPNGATGYHQEKVVLE